MVQTVRVSDELYARLRRTAAALHKPVDEVAAQALAAGLPPSANDAPAAFQAELRALEELSDEALWDLWHSSVKEPVAVRHRQLLKRNAEETLSPEERQELRQLRDEADRLLLRKAHAAALLRWRGHCVPIDG